MDADEFAVVLANTLGLEIIPRMEDRLVEDVNLDSLDLVELWVGLEYALDRSLDPAAIDELVTVRDVFMLWQTLSRSPQ